MSSYHVTIFGGGSVGLCLAAHFVEAGARVSLLVREASVDRLTGAPIQVSGLLGDYKISAGTITVSDAARPSGDVLRSDCPSSEFFGELGQFRNGGFGSVSV